MLRRRSIARKCLGRDGVGSTVFFFDGSSTQLCTAAGFINNVIGIAIHRPVCGIGSVSRAALADGDSFGCRRKTRARPSRKGISRFGGVIQRKCCCFYVVAGRVSGCGTAIQRVGNGITVSCPMRIYRSICCAHLSGTAYLTPARCRCVPAVERVARSGGRRQVSVSRIVVYALGRCGGSAAIGIECQRIRIYRPLGIKRRGGILSILSGSRHFIAFYCECPAGGYRSSAAIFFCIPVLERIAGSGGFAGRYGEFYGRFIHFNIPVAVFMCLRCMIGCQITAVCIIF